MSTRTEKPAGGGGLSATTLAIASVSSIAAAYVIHTFWTGGAILGAGITPIIVAIVSESLKRPTQRITAIREERRTRSQVSRRAPDETPVAPPPELERPDPFGIWQDEQRSGFHWVRGRALRLAVVTGLVAFGIAAFVVTGADLVFGKGSGGGSDSLTIVPGTQEREKTGERDEETTTQPAQTTQTAPGTEQPLPTTPAETTPVEPPAATQPAPVEPAPTTPAPETPAPEPTPEEQPQG